MNKWNFKQALGQTQRLFTRLYQWPKLKNTCVLCSYPTENLANLLCFVCSQDLDRFELGYDYLRQNPKGSAQVQHSNLAGLAFVSEYVWPFNQFIPSLKFYQGIIHSKWFGQMLDQQVRHQLWPRFDVVIPLPLHALREFKRGYNQAYLIASHMGSYRSKIDLTLLKRTKRTKPQSELNKKQRKSNMKDAFVCSERVKGKYVLLVDDVVTTGNSVNQAAKVLLEAGATAVYVAAVAIRTVD